MPRAFLTGITGQDGGYLSEELAAAGWDVEGLVQPSEDVGRIDTLRARVPGVTLHTGDLADPERLTHLVQQIAPDAVVNLGGISSVATSWQRPARTVTVVAAAPAALLEACWQLQQRRGTPVHVVQASSAEIFGSPASAPQDERTPLQPVNPYGAAKALAHRLVGIYRARGLPASSLILYTHESPRRPPSFVIRKITLAAARIAAGQQDVLELGNLDARRDWGWAPDYAHAMHLAMTTDRPADYVVATGRSHSVRDAARAALTAAGVADWERHVRVADELRRPADAAELRGDASRARSVLGWAPTLDFEQVIARMVDADRALVAGYDVQA